MVDKTVTRADLAEAVELLRTWDIRWSVESVPTSIAMFWGDALRSEAGSNLANASGDQMLSALATALEELEDGFGDWRTPWGEINRHQRVKNVILHTVPGCRTKR